MSRAAHVDDDEVFRAVVHTVETRDGRTREELFRCAGPYMTVGAARAALTRETKELERRVRFLAATRGPRDIKIVGRVERASTKWEEVQP